MIHSWQTWSIRNVIRAEITEDDVDDEEIPVLMAREDYQSKETPNLISPIRDNILMHNLPPTRRDMDRK